MARILTRRPMPLWRSGLVHRRARLPRGRPPGHKGRVCSSSTLSQAIASVRELPHISIEACRPAHTAGRSGRPKMRHCSSGPSCTQATPAGLPKGIPGIGVVMDGAMQHAPQPGRHCITRVGESAPSRGARSSAGARPCSISLPRTGRRLGTLGRIGRSGFAALHRFLSLRRTLSLLRFGRVRLSPGLSGLPLLRLLGRRVACVGAILLVHMFILKRPGKAGWRSRSLTGQAPCPPTTAWLEQDCMGCAEAGLRPCRRSRCPCERTPPPFPACPA